MLTRQRKELLLSRLKQDGRIVAKSLSEELGLSEDTIRRDLRELAGEGLLERVHGGALPLAAPLPASPAMGNFAQRQQISSDAKPAIGRAAARMITAGQVVFIDGGTTAVQLARHLPADLKCTVVTHRPSIAAPSRGPRSQARAANTRPASKTTTWAFSMTPFSQLQSSGMTADSG